MLIKIEVNQIYITKTVFDFLKSISKELIEIPDKS